MLKYGTLINKESLLIPQYKWAVMGFLDSVTGIMQSLAVNYVSNGSLVTLLTQSAIPSSMIISYIFLKTRYKATQYLGAVIVAIGIVIVLLPEFTGKSNNANAHNSIAWSLVLIASCIPMCLSRCARLSVVGLLVLDCVCVCVSLLCHSQEGLLRCDEFQRRDGGRCTRRSHTVRPG